MASLLRLLPSKAARHNNGGGVHMMKKLSSLSSVQLTSTVGIGYNPWSALTTANRFFSAETKHRNIGISAHIDRYVYMCASVYVLMCVYVMMFDMFVAFALLTICLFATIIH